jgi:hypothetical protein
LQRKIPTSADRGRQPGSRRRRRLPSRRQRVTMPRVMTSPHRAPRKQQIQLSRDPNAPDVAARRLAARRRWRMRQRARAAQRTGTARYEGAQTGGTRNSGLSGRERPRRSDCEGG